MPDEREAQRPPAAATESGDRGQTTVTCCVQCGYQDTGKGEEKRVS